MATDYSKYDIYVRSAPGVPFHEKWEAGPGGFRIFDLSGGGSRHFARLNSGVTHKDVFDAYTKGGTDLKGEKTAQSMVTKEPVIDPSAAANPGYDGLGSRVSWGSKSGSKSSSETSGKTAGERKKPVQKKTKSEKKPEDTKKNSGSDSEGSRGRDNSELDAARQRVEDARRKLEAKAEKVKQKADDAADALRSLQDLVDRLKKLVGDSSHVKSLLAQLRRAMLEAAASGEKIKTAKATAKNYRQLLQQNWLTDLRRRNGHHQPNPPFGKDMVSGDPVNLISGAFTLEQTDVSLPGRTFPLAVTRSYSNQIYCRGSFGTCWTAWFDANCRVMTSGAVYVWLGNGSGLWFLPDDDGGYRVPMGSDWTLTRKSKRFQLLNVEGAAQEFDDDGRLAKIEDRFGNWTRISRNDKGQPTGLKNSTGRELTIKGWPIREVKDSTGRTWSYRYDSQNNLIQVTLPKTKALPQERSTFYEYEAGSDPRTWHNLKRIRDTGRELALENIYGTKPETFNRVIEQEATGDTVLFRYEFLKTDIEDAPKNRQTATHRTTFTDTRGIGTTHEFNLWGQPLTMTHRPRTGPAVTLGQSWYDEDGNLAKVQRPRGNRLEFRRDQINKDPLRRSNVVEMQRFPAGSGSPLVTRIKYGDFNQVVETQSPDGAVTTCQLDKHGLVQKVVHPAVTLETGPPVSAETKIKWNRYGQPIEFLDAAGRRTSIAYYSSGGGAGLPKTQELNGRTTASFRYDTLGRLEESHDLAGVATVSEYDELDQLVKVSEPSILDTAVKYEYDALGQLVSESVRNLDENGKARSPEWISGRYVYDRKGRVVTVEEMLTATESAVSKFAWDSEDNLVETRDPQGGIGRFEYDDFGQLVRNVANPGRKRHGREVATTFEYDENGNQTATVDALGHRTETKYDGHDRPLESTDAAGNVFQQKWDSNADRVISTKLLDKAGTLRGEQRVEHDELGRVVAERTQIVLPDGTSPGWLKSKIHFDIAGQLRAMVDPLGNRSEFEYDSRGLLSTVRDAIGNVERTMHDDRGLVTEQVSELVDGITPTKRQVFVQRTGYDDLGRTAWQQDGLGNRVVFLWDGLNQLIATTAPDETAERFEYDLAGRMTRQTHSDGATSNWRFDSAGRLLDMTDPRGQITRINYDDWHAPVSATLPDGSLLFENRFDAAGRVYESIDGRGVKVRTKFDELSQPIEQTSLLRGNVEGITKQRFTWDAWGNFRSATNDNHSLQRVSDSLGRLHRETTDGRSTEWTFGKNHLVSKVTYPEGFALQHDWDQHGRLKSLQPVWQTGGFVVPRPGSAGPLAEFDWLGAELPQRHTFGNGLQTTSQIDAAGRLISQTTRDSAGKNVERITTLRDAAGQVRHMNREGLHATDYDYDQTGQLTEVREGKPASSADVSAWLPSADSAAPDPKGKQKDLTKLISKVGPGSTPQTTTNFTYDRAGNREQVDRSGGGQATRTNYLADSANRYTQIDGQLQKYDAAGNLIDDGRFQFRYDAFNQLVRVIDVQTGEDILKQSHDPLGRVAKRWIDGSEETLT
ncbi:MAG: YD repeat-containing protein, partial [Porticoccaceae bacterium]